MRPDTVKDDPLYPVGTVVYSDVFRDPSKPKMVLYAQWDGAEYRYTLVDENRIRDEGYLAKDFRGEYETDN